MDLEDPETDDTESEDASVFDNIDFITSSQTDPDPPLDDTIASAYEENEFVCGLIEALSSQQHRYKDISLSEYRL